MCCRRSKSARQQLALNPIFDMEMQMKKFIALVVMLSFGALSFGALSGCNTMAGVGKDIERGGEKIEGAAQRNK